MATFPKYCVFESIYQFSKLQTEVGDWYLLEYTDIWVHKLPCLATSLNVSIELRLRHNPRKFMTFLL